MLALVHALDDAFLNRQPGVDLDQHLLAAAIRSRGYGSGALRLNTLASRIDLYMVEALSEYPEFENQLHQIEYNLGWARVQAENRLRLEEQPEEPLPPGTRLPGLPTEKT